ncbi:MarR family winged helix-turn-helix transcriptional regulator [Calidifontibacter terrae]
MTAPLPDDREVASLLNRLDTSRRVAEQQGELRAADGRLLWLLSDGRGRSLREIAEELNLEQSTVNRQVNAALKTGLVGRSRAGGRSWQFAVTEQGKQAFEVGLAEHLSLFAGALTAVADRPAFLADLARFVDAYADQVRRATWSSRGPERDENH